MERKDKWLAMSARLGRLVAPLVKLLAPLVLLLVVALELQRPALEFCESLWNNLNSTLPLPEYPEWQSQKALGAHVFD